MRKNISEVIAKAINEIIARYALQEQRDTARFNENALYVLWLMREQIHNIEKNLLQSNKASFDCNSHESSDYLNLKVGEIAKKILKPLLENTQWSDDDLKSFLNKADSSKIFGISHSLLSLERFDKYNRSRYYAKKISVNGKQYFFCSQWNEKPSRNKLVKFINQYKKEIK